MARRMFDLLAFASFSYRFGYALGTGTASVLSVSGTPPPNASAPIPEAFVSYSIEFVYFPDFAGMALGSRIVQI